MTGIETHRQKKDGSPVYINISARSLYDIEGKVASINGANEDITKRKENENALKKSERKFRLLAENARDLIYRIKVYPKQEFENTLAPPQKKLRVILPKNAMQILI